LNIFFIIKMDKIKEIIEEAQEEGLLGSNSYYYYIDGKNQGFSYCKIKRVTEILKKIKSECNK
jgi:hypothetical protein